MYRYTHTAYKTEQQAIVSVILYRQYEVMALYIMSVIDSIYLNLAEKLMLRLFLSLHRASWRFTYYHIPTNALIISFII
jgi:hypothetical protein